jgi:8-oxo-dGTP pyrophosphatase MutT (NUDIX family)
MVGSSILPACFYKGAIYFLFGKENDLADTPGWSDFGGGVEPGEDLFDAALREGGEEMTGFLGGEKELRALIQKNGGVYKKTVETYNAHIFHYPYDPNLPVYYNNNHRFLWNKMDKKMLNDTKLFEKIEVAWFSIEDMKKRRGEFRNFYQNIVDEIIKDQTKIRQFLTKGNKSGKKTRRRQSKI